MSRLVVHWKVAESPGLKHVVAGSWMDSHNPGRLNTSPSSTTSTMEVCASLRDGAPAGSDHERNNGLLVSIDPPPLPGRARRIHAVPPTNLGNS
eukprot:1407804-Pyramimonas_sp.AAC.1